MVIEFDKKVLIHQYGFFNVIKCRLIFDFSIEFDVKISKQLDITQFRDEIIISSSSQFIFNNFSWK